MEQAEQSNAPEERVEPTASAADPAASRVADPAACLTPTPLLQYLSSIGQEQYFHVLQREEVDLDVLRTLTSAELRSLGIKLGHVKRIQSGLGQLAGGPPPTPPHSHATGLRHRGGGTEATPPPAKQPPPPAKKQYSKREAPKKKLQVMNWGGWFKGLGLVIVITVVIFMGASLRSGSKLSDGTFTHKFTKKPLGISLGPVAATGTKVTKVGDPTVPIKVGDVVVSIGKKGVSSLPFKEVAKKLQKTPLPFSILFVRPSEATAAG